jgi:hypothetical protein
MVSQMPKLSPREAVKAYQVSRATLTKALLEGKISAEKTESGHWQIDPSELARIYQPRAPQKPLSRSKLAQPDQLRPTGEHLADHTLELRLARAEAALEAEREKTALLERHVADLRRMLPAPETEQQPRRRRWWWS